MSKQTAVEWLTEKLNQCEPMYSGVQSNEHKEHLDTLIEQAKEMEKEQMWEYIKKIYCIGHKSLEFHRLEFEQYYNETFKNKNNV
jgi:hypothetical protein